MARFSSTKTIQTRGQIAAARHDVQTLMEMLDGVPMWRPAAALQKECREVLDLLDSQERRFDRKLCVVVIGPGGAGKSTLVNALAGRDALTPVGIQRPTTQQAVLVCRSAADGDFITAAIDSADVQVVTEPETFPAAHYVLVDTPDIDSTQQHRHRKVVADMVAMADVLVCVFNAENPKTRDHVDFFGDYVRRFDGGSLIGVLNKCDRVDETELKGYIVPDFQDYIAGAWGRPLNNLFCVSARRHLQAPAWDRHAEPKHDFDQYRSLADMLTDVSALTSATLDRRRKNAQQLVRFVHTEVRDAVQQRRSHMEAAWALMKKMQDRGLKSALDAIKDSHAGHGMGVNVQLYQRIAQQWFGPVGWLIALWARILIFGSGLLALFRFGNPIRQIVGLVSAMRHFKDAKASIAGLDRGDVLDAAMRRYRLTFLSDWPEISERLVQAGWDASARVAETQMAPNDSLRERLVSLWQETLSATIETASRRFSGVWLQLLFNLPSVALLAHIAWLTTRRYLAADYLATDFFLHACVTALITLFLSFFLFQALLSLCYGPRRIIAISLEKIQRHLDAHQSRLVGPVSEQLQTLLAFVEPRNR